MCNCPDCWGERIEQHLLSPTHRNMASPTITALPEDVLRRIFGQPDEKDVDIIDTQCRCVLRVTRCHVLGASHNLLPEPALGCSCICVETVNHTFSPSSTAVCGMSSKISCYVYFASSSMLGSAVPMPLRLVHRSHGVSNLWLIWSFRCRERSGSTVFGHTNWTTRSITRSLDRLASPPAAAYGCGRASDVCMPDPPLIRNRRG